MNDDYLQRRLDELHAACEEDPAEVARLYLDASFRRLRRSSDAIRRAAEALARKLDPPPGSGGDGNARPESD